MHVGIHPEAIRDLEGMPYPYQKALFQARKMPRDYLLWSFLTFNYLNCCCLGLAALVFSVKSRDCKVVGDPEGAANHAKTARCLNIAALTLAILICVILIILVVTSAASIYKKFQEVLTEVHDSNFNEPANKN